MKMQSNTQTESVFRNSELITGRTRKMAHTYIGSAICVAAVTAVDSLIAGISIGESALASIGAAAPLLAIDQILHCLLGFGISKMMIHSVGMGKRKEADRIFGAVLIAVAAAFLLVYIPLLIFERPLLGLFMKDQTLLDGVILYTRPVCAVFGSVPMHRESLPHRRTGKTVCAARHHHNYRKHLF